MNKTRLTYLINRVKFRYNELIRFASVLQVIINRNDCLIMLQFNAKRFTYELSYS